MEFRILGPVELWVEGRPLTLGPPKQRCVLAALLLDVGKAVNPEILIDRVWDENPPVEVRNVLYTYVTRLRRILEAAVARSGECVELIRRSGGYVISANPDLVDLHRFRRLLDHSRQNAVADDHRSQMLNEAVLLWRGSPLGGLNGPWAGRVRAWLESQHISARSELAETELRLGRHSASINLLREALVDHPLSELLCASLLRALRAAGRDAEALETYGQVRNRFVDEIGAEPGLELQALHRELLTGVRRVPRRYSLAVV